MLNGRSSWLIKVFQSKAREFLTRASGSFAPHPLRDVLTKRRWWEKAHPAHGPRQGVPRQRLVGGQVLGRPVAERPALSPGRTPNLGRCLYHMRPRIELIADDDIGRGLAFAALIRAGGRGMRAGRLVWSGISTLGLGAFAMSRNSLGPLSSLRLPRCRSSSVEDRRVFAWGRPARFARDRRTVGQAGQSRAERAIMTDAALRGSRSIAASGQGLDRT
jgi:hypothetical protein